MSSSITTSPDQDTSTSRRSVARRACLSCREKKIKCDGEVVSRMNNENEADTVRHNPKVCTNCKFLGIECIFVQSMRGGRRKRRDDTETDNAKSMKTEHNDENITSSTMKSSNTGSSYTTSNSTLIASDPKAKFGPPSPSLFYSLPYVDAINGPQRSKGEFANDAYGQPYAYDYGYYPPSTDNWDRHHSYDPPPLPPLMMGYAMPGPPGQPGASVYYPNHHLGPLHSGPPYHTRHRKHHWKDHSTSPHMMGHPHSHHKKHHWHEYSGLPHLMGYSHPNPRHQRKHLGGHSTQPHMMGHPHHSPRPHHGHGMPTMRTGESLSPGVSGSGSNQSSRSGSVSGNGISYQPRSNEDSNRHPSFIIPRLDGTPASGYTCSYYSADPYGGKNDAISSQMPDSSKITYGMAEGIYTQQRRLMYENEQEEYEEPFSSHELIKHELPNWIILNKLLDYYYKYNHPKHQLLSSKRELIKRISLNSDSSILHAIISTVCLINEGFECEASWIEKVFKYWDNLNDFGMLLSYSLISKSSVVQFDFNRSNDLYAKIWELIRANKFIDIVNEPKENLNSRQLYEKERVIRIIWNYWVNHVILRFKQGFPHYQLPKETENLKLNGDFDKYVSNLVLPLSDEDNLKQKGRRLNFDALNNIDFSKDEIIDSHTVILATKRLETTIRKISMKELTEESGFNNELNNFVNDKVLTINQDNTVFMINSSYLLASFIMKTNDCLHSSHFISDIIFSGMHKNQTEESKLIPLADNILVKNIFNFEGLSTLIEDLSNFQWSCLTNLIISVSDIIKLIEIGSGILPNEDDKHMVIIGVTNMGEGENRPWWENQELITDQYDSWYKYPDFALYSAYSLISMLASLIILTKFINFTEEDSVLKVELLHTKGERQLDLPRNHEFIEEFNISNMMQKLSGLINFIKFKLQSNHGNTELISDSEEKFDKISLHVEEALGAISDV